jgi:hypothetical protein
MTVPTTDSLHDGVIYAKSVIGTRSGYAAALPEDFLMMFSDTLPFRYFHRYTRDMSTHEVPDAGSSMA